MTWAPDYLTRQELKDYLRVTDNAYDALFDVWITTVSRNVDEHCGRQFGQVASTEERVYTPFWDRHEQAWFVEMDDLQDTTGFGLVDEDGTAIPVKTSTVAGYQFLPRNAAAKGRPYEQLKITTNPGVEVTADALWGWAAVPSAVKTGALLQAARLNHRRSSPFGISGSPSEGTQIRLLAQLDPDFRTSLRPFVREWWAA